MTGLFLIFRFASRAKNIKNKPVVNEVLNDAALLKRYSKEIKKLQQALESERQSKQADAVIQVKEKLDEAEQINEELKSKVRLLNEKLVTSTSCRTPKQTKENKAARRKTWAAPPVKSRASLKPLDLASINAQFSFPFPPPGSTASERSMPRRLGLPKISEVESVSECSFVTASEFSDINSSVLRQMEESIQSEQIVRPKPSVSFASPSVDDEVFPEFCSVTTRKRKGSIKVSMNEPPTKCFRDVESQTETSLLPKPK